MNHFEFSTDPEAVPRFSLDAFSVNGLGFGSHHSPPLLGLRSGGR